MTINLYFILKSCLIILNFFAYSLMVIHLNSYMFEDKINQKIALEIFKKTIMNDNRFLNEIDENLLSIEQKYKAYYFFEASITNLCYYYKNLETNQTLNSTINLTHILSDSEFILNELNRSNADLIEEIPQPILDNKKYDLCYKEFINEINEKALKEITAINKIKPSRTIHIDIAPIENFQSFNCEVFYEKVYIFRYRHQQQKKDFISILSSYNMTFYELNYVKNDLYLEFIKKYSRPLEVLPKEYLSFYYVDSFNIYKNIIKRLNYENPKDILKKIKTNIKFTDNNLYEDYLKSAIFYFHYRKYLKNLPINFKSLRQHIYLSYLTLNYQIDSGLFLYKCATLNLLTKNTFQTKIKFLQKSYHLGSLEAKKILYEIYNMPLYFNPTMVKKYS